MAEIISELSNLENASESLISTSKERKKTIDYNF